MLVLRFDQQVLCAIAWTQRVNAFSEQAIGQFGNAGQQHPSRTSQQTVFDFSLMRDFLVSERVGLEAKWEVFNLANSPIFGQPNNNLSSGAVGSITSLASDARIMQFALRLSF